jgi:alkanesulfonate monooxygenase SsuD/methylene tetrahydromethanopterin reductase-like flavin-dependent oxidoreductase (luciferase family)
MTAEFGVFLIPDAEHPEHTIELALTAERLGLDLIGVQDHPYQHRFFDAFSLLAFIAGRTERIKLVPDVANLPLRPPAALAKSGASIDLLSGGRFELGLGAGAFWDGIAGMGGPRRTPKDAVDALREAIEVIRLAWSGEPTVSYEGRHYRVDGFKPGPLPAHRIGIWLGAYRPRMVRLTGSSADGWLPSIPRLPLDQVLPRQHAIDEAASNAGRDPAKIRRVANVNGKITSGERDGFLRGPAAQWVDDLRWMRDEYRFDTFIFWGDGDPDEQLRRFVEDVVPTLRAD